MNRVIPTVFDNTSLLSENFQRRWEFFNVADAKNILQKLQNNHWNVVKRNIRRDTFDVGPYFAKIYYFSSMMAQLKKTVKMSARHEWNVTCQAYQSNLATPKPIAFGRTFNLAIIVTQKIENSITFTDFFHKNWDTINHSDKYIITDLFATFFISLLQSGLIQKDFNWGNLLFNRVSYQIFMVDLQRASWTGRKLSTHEIVVMLTKLQAAFLKVEDRYKLRFFNRILTIYPGLKNYGPYIRNRGYNRMRHQWLKKPKRKFYENRFKMYDISTGRVRGYLQRGMSCQLKALIQDQPGKLFEYELKNLKKSKRSRISLILWEDKKYIVKQYYVKSRLFLLKSLIGSLAHKTWVNNYLFCVRDLPTPKLLAAVDAGQHFQYQGTFLVYEYIQGVNGYLEKMKCFLEEASSRNLLIHKLAELLGHMHQRGVFHGDAKISNYIWSERSAPHQFFVIDLDSVTFAKKISSRQRLSDLGDMISSLEWLRRDRCIMEDFFKRYETVDTLWCQNRKRFLHTLRRRIEEKLLSHQHRYKE